MTLDARGQRAGSPRAAPARRRALVGRHLRPDPAPPRRPVLAGDDQRVDRGARHLHRAGPARPVVGPDRRRRRGGDRPRPRLGRRGHLLADLLRAGRRRLRRRERPDQAGPPGPAQRAPAGGRRGRCGRGRACSSPRRRTSTRSTAPGTCSSPRAGPAPATRSRSRAGPRPPGRSRAARTTRSSATAAPTTRCRTPATPTSCRRPTARGGWCCSASGARGAIPEVHVLGRETFLTPRALGRRLARGRAGAHGAPARGPAPARRLRGAASSARSGSRCARAPTTRGR